MFGGRRDTGNSSYLPGFLGITALVGAAYPLLVRYGVCGGFMLSLLIAGLCAAAGKFGIVRGVARRRPIRPLTVAGLAVLSLAIGFGAGSVAAREPSPEAVFRKHLKLTMPARISDAHACVRWAFADPAYYVRFRAERETIEKLAWDLKLHKDEAPERVYTPSEIGGMPAWWDPAELHEPVSWRSSSGGPFIHLYADLQRGVAYVILAYP